MTETILDLCITLVPPPPDASPEAIATIELRCDQLGLSHTGDLLIDLFTKREREDMRWYLEEYVEWPYEQFLERGKKLEAALPEFGKRLYAIICTSTGAMGVMQAWRLQPGALQRQVSIISEIPKALSLPWELLHDEQGFLVLRTRNPVALIRRLPQHELGAFPTSFQPPLRILLVTARPDGEEFVDPRSIARELLDEVQQQVDAGAIALEFLRPPTLPALRRRLSDSRQPSIQVLHFDGHGILSQEKHGQGMLVFEDEQGRADLVEAKDVAQVLQDSGVKLAVLTACRSAVGNTDDALSSVAAQFIRSGVDAVMAMSASVLVVTATRYTEALYRALAAGTPAPVAQERARQALHDDQRRTLHHRWADDEGTVVTLRDWWLPHYYQQRSVSLQPAKPTRKRKKVPEVTLPHLNADLPVAPRYGFSGRSYELLRIERTLLQKKLVVIHGFGGIGKTALAREAAEWFTRTHLYDGACFLSFEQGGDATTVLSTLGSYLGVYDGNYDPGKVKAALARLQPALLARKTLVIADNLESVLPHGEAPLEPAECTLLWNVLLGLATLGIGMILTTRDTSFGDGRMAPGQHIRYLMLQGLQPDDAYALATRLLEDLGIEHARAPYADLRALLAQLDHHPLAIQLALPSLRERSLAAIRADFATLLPTFKDDMATGRNRSLLTSLDYSLHRLTATQRTLLSRLAVFEGGALETTLLYITQISEVEWTSLRPALEQVALLTPEPIKGIVEPFLHFHPVLTPYLRSQPGVIDLALCRRAAQHYAVMAHKLYLQDNQHSQAVRALVQHELPNLRRALVFLLETSDLEEATELTGIIVRFLTLFGRWRERDELRQRMAETLAAQQVTDEACVLTYTEFLQESGLGEDEYQYSNLQAATTRFARLLANIEAQLAEAPLGLGSYAHCETLTRLARCLKQGQQPAAAERLLQQALGIINTLLLQQPEDTDYLHLRGALVIDLANTLTDQGYYAQARSTYEEALKIDLQLGYRRGQAITEMQMGYLALKQGSYPEARTYYMAGLHIFQELDEPEIEATVWHQLGLVAQAQNQWSEAESYYRKSLVIKDRLGDTAGSAATCNQLALVATETGHPFEAEGWFQRALERFAQAQSKGSEYARALYNLAALLVIEFRAGNVAPARLAEAKCHAEQALAIEEMCEVSESLWKNFNILAEIATLEGQEVVAHHNRRRTRETFAAFSGNRYQIERLFGPLIVAAATAAQGDPAAQQTVEAALPELEAQGLQIAAAMRRLWADERDWHALAEGLNPAAALLILRILETLAVSESDSPA
jgi:tetratricopeptide (TPR) repeat protein